MTRKPLDPATVTLEAWLAANKELAAARKKLTAASERRRALPAGSTRARVTTAEAKWAIAAEAHDRIDRALRDRWEAAQASKETP
jgi:hypothetical protein